MSEIYKSVFCTVPYRILELPRITIQLLRFYEKIFQFWHRGHDCFVSNSVLMEAAGMKDDGTVRAAFRYFEKHGEIKRETINGQRFIVQPQRRVQDRTENKQQLSTDPGCTQPVTRLNSTPPPGCTQPHNKKNANKKNLNKSSYASRPKNQQQEQKTHEPLPDDHFLKHMERKRENERPHSFSDSMRRASEVKPPRYRDWTQERLDREAREEREKHSIQ